MIAVCIKASPQFLLAKNRIQRKQEKFGREPDCSDLHDNLAKTPAEIIAGIRCSRFPVAEFTHEKQYERRSK